MISEAEINALLEKGQKNDKAYAWNIKIEADCNDGDYSYCFLHYSDDISFMKEGLPLCLILNKLSGHHVLESFEDSEWLDEVLRDFDCLPSDEWGLAHTITDIDIDGPKGKLDLNVFSNEQSEEIIRYFLTDTDYFDYSEKDIDSIIQSIFSNISLRLY